MALAEAQYQLAETNVRPERVDELFLYRDEDGKASYYPGQRDVICEILQAYMDGKRTVIADAPTGCGKSLIANTVMKYLGGAAWGATPKNVLVDQYEELGWKTIRGLTSYNCKTHRGQNCYKGTMLARAEGKIEQRESGCQPDCPARRASMVFFRNDGQGAMTNTSYLWSNLPKFEKANGFDQRKLIVIDEAHMLEASLADMVSLTVTERDLKEMNFTQVLGDPKQLEQWLRDLSDHLDGFIAELYAELKELKGKHGKNHPSIKVQMARIENTQRKTQGLETYLTYRNATQWLRSEPKMDEDGRLIHIKIEPVYGSFLVKKCLNLAPYALMMSATFLSKEMSCVEMDLASSETAYIQIPSYFPPENQPIYYDQSLCLNRGNLEQNMPLLVEKIDKILDYESGRRGIIHSHSHAITQAIYSLSRHRRRFSCVENGEKQLDAIQKHIDSKDSVLLGPGFVEGVDLKGELGQFFITAKVPFMPMLGDPKLMIREKEHNGYCDLLTARALIQGAGRVVRGAHETANGYILDGNLNRLLGNARARSYFPKSFIEKIRSFQI